MDAYRRGVFPWPHDSIRAVPWFSPPRRGVLPLDRIHLSRSLLRTIRRCGFSATLDAAFAGVVAGCREPRSYESGTWISDELAGAYIELHRLGHAHSVEVWDGQRLVGGIYGVLVGSVFCGESMFHRVADASKIALADLAARLNAARAGLLEVQHATPHLRSLGAIEIPREVYRGLLAELRDDEIRLLRDRLPVSRLAERGALDVRARAADDSVS
jgi:leucyl/phenylalanyl-tRNA--protein transferase